MNLIVYFLKNRFAKHCDNQKHSMTAVFLCLSLMLFSVLSSAQVGQIQGPRNASQTYSGVVYGPIDSSDTLWGIASRYKQGSQFSVYQTMYAIYELNPQAFENGNFNKMVSGATLQLPSDSYIARIDPNIAREKAFNDERRATTNRPNQTSVQKSSQSSQPSVSALNSPLSQSNSSSVQKGLQDELNTLRVQQQEQFELLKEQVSESIKTVQLLIQENKQLSEQLKTIDENNRTLTESVESQLQKQIDEQMAQLTEIVELVKAAEEQKKKQEEESLLGFLASPIAIIVIMSVVTISLLVGIALLLLKRTSPQAQEDKPVESAKETNSDIVDDDLVIGEVDDIVDKDSDELLEALSESNSDDDILSDELASDEALENLDDDLLTDELDSLDDMLVPDSPDLEGTADSQNSAFENTSELDVSDLGDEVEDLTNTDAGSQGNKDKNQTIETGEQDKAAEPLQNDLAASTRSTDNEDGTPDGIELNDSGDIDDKTLSQIEEQIEQKDSAINDIADDIIASLDSGSPDNDSATTKEEKSDLDLDEIDLLIQQNENNTTTNEASLDQSTAPQDESSNTQEITSTGIKNEQNSGIPELDSSNPKDDVDSAQPDGVVENPTSDSSTSDEIEEDLDQLSDDLLDELTQQTNESDELDDLLNLSDFDDQELSLDQEKSDNKQAAKEVEDTDDKAEGDTDPLTDDLLKELENPDEPDEAPVQTKEKSEASIDEDEFLNDIPSFTSDISQEDETKKPDTKQSESSLKTETKDLNEESIPSSVSDSKKSDTDKIEDTKTELEEDVLSGLPDLDNWVDEEPDKSTNNNISEETTDDLDFSALELDVDDLDISDKEFAADSSSEDDILSEFDNNDFDDMLSELSKEDSTNLSDKVDKSDYKNSTPFEEAGLDLEQLTSEPSSKEDDFLDVDELLKDSESTKSKTDEELVLDLEKSLGSLSFGSDGGEEDTTLDSTDSSEDQSGNLDLAQVYIDMEDEEAASELLEKVIKEGNAEEQKEAKSLLASLSR